MKLTYAPTSKIFRASHLLNETLNNSGVPGEYCTDDQFREFERNFLRPNEYSIFDDIPLDRLLSYALTRPECFIRWLVRNKYFKKDEKVQLIVETTKSNVSEISSALVRYTSTTVKPVTSKYFEVLVRETDGKRVYLRDTMVALGKQLSTHYTFRDVGEFFEWAEKFIVEGMKK